MNEIQIYSIIMFFAGVLLTKAVFYFDRKIKKKQFYIFLSAIILQVLDNIDAINQATTAYTQDKLKTIEDSEKQEYLEKEGVKTSAFMELYLLLLIRSVPKEGRQYINYKSWPEAKALIEQMRGFFNNEQSRR